MFQEGLDIAHENVLRVLELMWMKFIDDASHYNHITGQCLQPASSYSDVIVPLTNCAPVETRTARCSVVGGTGMTAQPPSPGGSRHGQQLHGHKHLGRARSPPAFPHLALHCSNSTPSCVHLLRTNRHESRLLGEHAHIRVTVDATVPAQELPQPGLGDRDLCHGAHPQRRAGQEVRLLCASYAYI
jgi:hypothetical protein